MCDIRSRPICGVKNRRRVRWSLLESLVHSEALQRGGISRIVNAKVLLTHFANLEVTHPERISVGESSLFSHREPIFHAITLSVNDNCFGMVKRAIKQSCASTSSSNASSCLLLSSSYSSKTCLKSGQILG